jgi:hypothetical protein
MREGKPIEKAGLSVRPRRGTMGKDVNFGEGLGIVVLEGASRREINPFQGRIGCPPCERAQ